MLCVRFITASHKPSGPLLVRGVVDRANQVAVESSGASGGSRVSPGGGALSSCSVSTLSCTNHLHPLRDALRTPLSREHFSDVTQDITGLSGSEVILGPSAIGAVSSNVQSRLGMIFAMEIFRNSPVGIPAVTARRDPQASVGSPGLHPTRVTGQIISPYFAPVA